MGTDAIVKKKPQKTISWPKPFIKNKQNIKLMEANKMVIAKFLEGATGSLVFKIK